MSLLKISEKFVISKLKSIKNGNLKLINYDGKVYHFGDLESSLTTDIQINNNNSNDSPSQSPIKGGKRYRFTSSMKRVDKISKDLNLCDFIEDEGEEVSHHTSKSF